MRGILGLYGLSAVDCGFDDILTVTLIDGFGVGNWSSSSISESDESETLLDSRSDSAYLELSEAT